MPKVAHVNTTDIQDAIRLGCRTMCSVFDADDDNRPFFGSRIFPDARLEFSSAHSESHVPGRHLNALLNAEDVLGLALDERAVANHTRAALFSYSGPLPLPLNRERKDGPLHVFIPHNVREGFHALYALVNYRRSERARRLAETSIVWILQHWDTEAGWDIPAVERAGIKYVRWQPDTFIMGLGRAIGPLVKYYRATGYARALELALALADKATTDFFRADGAFDPDRFGAHTHSTTCVMAGLALLADLLGDAALLGRVKAFYDNGLWQIRDALGWVIESTKRQGMDADVGEVNNTGDIVETALILGKHGFPEYYEDAERILRCHLLPSQLRDTSFIRDPPNPTGEDGRRNVADRHLGAFGFPTPYGHMPPGAKWLSFNMDIVGGATGSLCEACRHVVRSEDSGLWVNLLFDHETDALRVESPYTHPCLRITVTRPTPVWVRIPSWVAENALTVRADGHVFRRLQSFLFFPAPPVGSPIEIAFPLPERQLVLKHRAHDIRVRLRGDAVATIDGFGADLTFFDPF